jgi:hypothetical protein
MIRRALTTLSPLALASCAATSGGVSATVELTRIGAAVQVTENATATQECEYVTDLPLRSSNPADENALRALRNAAGAAGANLVLLVMETRSAILRAEGYLCADEE